MDMKTYSVFSFCIWLPSLLCTVVLVLSSYCTILHCLGSPPLVYLFSSWKMCGSFPFGVTMVNTAINIRFCLLWERDNVQARGGEREMERENSKHTPCSARSPRWDSISQLWDHYLSWNGGLHVQPTESPRRPNSYPNFLYQFTLPQAV